MGKKKGLQWFMLNKTYILAQIPSTFWALANGFHHSLLSF